MLIRASGPLTEDLFLLTLGVSTRYLLLPSDGPAALIDPGASVHCDALLQRLARLDVAPQRIGYIFLTHPHGDRAGAAARLKQLNPASQVIGSAAMQAALLDHWSEFEQEDSRAAAIAGFASAAAEPLPRFKIDRVVVEGETVTIAPGLTARVLASSGHSAASFSYFIEPYRALVGDEVLGYFRGRDLPAPGCDESIASAAATLTSLIDLDISILCLPYVGALTGELVQRHLQSVKHSIEDVVSESKKARAAGIVIEEIRSQIERGLYTSDLADPLFNASLKRAFSGLWKQIEPMLTS